MDSHDNRLACTMHFKYNKTKKWQMDEKISGIKGTKMTKVCPWFVLNIFSQVLSVCTNLKTGTDLDFFNQILP